MVKKLISKKQFWYLLIVVFLGLCLRLYFVPQFIKTSGDIRLYADWGEKLVTYKAINFYQRPLWYYAPPNYPPVLSLIYGTAFWLYEQRYLLPQLHSLIRIPPAFFIRYFYEEGYYLLLKLPGILADLGIAYLIYKFIFEIKRNRGKALFGFTLYFLNPVTIFLSSIWGQSDSLIAFLGLLSFYFLYKGKFELSLPLLFTSLYIKPNWGIFIPLYLYLTYVIKPKVRQIVAGGLVSALIFVLATTPFAKNIVEFTYWLLVNRILPTATVAHRASISAFNLYTIFFRFDFTPDNFRLLGIMPLNLVGYLLFGIVNLIAFYYLARSKVKLERIIFSLFIIGFGAYLFLTNMLERYFFAAFAPMIVLALTKPKSLFKGLFLNLAVFINLYYAFFRRSGGKLVDVLVANNALLIRLVSSINVVFWFLVTKDFLLKLRRD